LIEKEDEKMKLNLGCGMDIRKGFENYDTSPCSKKVKYIDLNSLPLPFQDNSVDYVYMSSVFEHLDVNRFRFMKEIHRILKPDGIVEIIVPRNCSSVAHTIPRFNKSYFDCICNSMGRCHWFDKISCNFVSDGSVSGWLFKYFPIFDKLFPFMFNGSIIWKLKKIKCDLNGC